MLTVTAKIFYPVIVTPWSCAQYVWKSYVDETVEAGHLIFYIHITGDCRPLVMCLIVLVAFNQLSISLSMTYHGVLFCDMFYNIVLPCDAINNG